MPWGMGQSKKTLKHGYTLPAGHATILQHGMSIFDKAFEFPAA
jgi:hypothetical protein